MPNLFSILRALTMFQAIELARGDVDVIRPLMAQLASVAALDPPDSDIDPSVAPCIATTTIDSTGAASSVVASSVAEEASVVQGAPPAIPPSVEKKKPTGWGVPSGKPKPPPPPPAT